MNFKTYLFGSLLLLWSTFLMGQSLEQIKGLEASLDSLKGVELVQMHSKISFSYAFLDIEKGYDWSFKAKKLADASGNLLAKSTAYRTLGVVYDIDSKSDSAFYYFNRSLEFAQQLNSGNEIGKSINNLGMYHWRKGELFPAVNKFIDALAIYEGMTDEISPSNIARTYNNVCLIYNELAQNEKAIPYCEKALKINSELKDTAEVLSNINNLGISNLNLGRWTKAIDFFEQGIRLSANDAFELHNGNMHSGLASIYLEQGRFVKAQKEIQIAIAKIGTSDLNQLQKSLNRASAIENRLGNYRAGKKYALQGLEIVDSLGIQGFSATQYEELAKANFGLGKMELGIQALEKWSHEKDNTFSAVNAENLAQKEVEYETAKKEKQILEQEVEIQKQANANKTLAFTLLAGLLLFSLAFVYWRGKTEREKLLAIQRVESQAKNDQLYALLEGEEQERIRLARDLHDGLGQVLSTARMNVSALEEVPFESDDKNIWSNSLALIDRAMDEMRVVSHDLTATALKENDLLSALKEMSTQLNTSRTDFVTIENLAGELTLNRQQEKIIFRVIQELINNSIKHAQEAQLKLSIEEKSSKYLFSFHQTKGIVNEEKLELGTGIGWSNIKSRLGILNGRIIVEPSGAGTDFLISFPKKLK